VVEHFKQPLWVGFYMGVMLLLGLHLRHGFWSAFHTIGVLNPRLRGAAFSFAVLFAVVIALGFFVLPLYVFLFSPMPATGVAMVAP
jgi:succinate dehydrogenase / fumarate reductase cytochrome b subunit